MENLEAKYLPLGRELMMMMMDIHMLFNLSCFKLPHGGCRQPGPGLCHVHAVWGGQWADKRTCDRIEVNLAKSRAETIVRKATGNHLTHYYPKKHGRKFSTTLLLWGILMQWLEKVKRIEW